MAPEVAISEEPRDDFARRWFQPMREHGATFCAPNLDTRLAFLRTPRVELPLSINEAEWDNSWICSPFTHYISYARDEVARLRRPWLGRPVEGILGLLGRWLRRADFNRVVMVNNWLLSTAPWPAWPAWPAEEDVAPILAALAERWPGHAVVFRSLHARESAALLTRLEEAGAILIPSRQVWWFEPDSPAVASSRDYRRDVKFLRRPDLEVVPHEELEADDFPALAGLYGQLYLDKYSRHNPRFTVGWLRYAWENHLLKFTALRDASGMLVGVEACGRIYGTLTSPIVGYDLTQPRELGLYRRLAVVPILEARRQQIPLNLSAGVGRYKALRGGEAMMEYLAVFDRHLPAARRRPWRMIQLLSKHLLAPAAARW